MLEMNELKKLMIATTKASRSNPVAYSFNGESMSYEDLNDTLRNELKEYGGTMADFRENKNAIFRLIEETLTEVLPKTVANRYEAFAETKQFAQGEKVVFKRRGTGRQRAKQFITRVGLAGVYEVFKLGGAEYFEVPTSAIGGAASIGFEEFLDGRVDWGEVVQIVYEGMDELIGVEISKALQGAINQLPANNQVVANGFDEAAMDKLLALASMYGDPTIYCDYEFAVKMVPAKEWTSDSMRDERWNNGYFTRYKGHRVVIMPQALVDESNSRKKYDPGYAWVIPSGADTHPVKVAFEGGVSVLEREQNWDWSREIHIYQKVGVGVTMTNDIFSYIDSDLQGHLDW